MSGMTEACTISKHPGFGRLARNAVGVALGTAATGVAGQVAAQAVDTQLPVVSVQGTPGGAVPKDGYHTSMPSLDKLTQPLLDTPQTITEVPRALIDDEGITSVRDALRNVPGVSIQAGEGGQQGDNLSIRGFNAQNDFYLDGMRDFGSYTRDPFNQQSIEVLEGPSSVLFGRGSAGGVINQVSKQPQLAPVTTGTVQFGTDGTERSTFDINRAIPNASGTAIRLNAMVDEGGVAGQDVTRNRRFGLAPEVAFGLGTNTRVILDYFKEQQYDTPSYGIPWLNGKPAPVNTRNFYGYPNHDHFRTNIDIGTLRVEHDFNDSFTVASQTRYGSYRRDLRVTEPLITGYTTSQDIVPASVPLSSIKVSQHVIGLSSQETLLDHEDDTTFRFKTGPLQQTLLAGIEIERQTSNPTRYTISQSTVSLLTPDTSTAYNLESPATSISGSTANNYAAFLTDTIQIGKYIQVIGGWRWDRFDSTFKQIIAPVTHVSRNDDVPTWRAAVVYKPVENASIYVSYGTSFDPSAEALSLSAATAAVAPEMTRNYEIGGKWDMFGSRLSMTGAVYDLAMTNVRETDPNDPTQDILAGNYRVRGFQVGVTGHVTANWQVFTGYSFNDAEVVSSPNANELGHAPPNAPRHTFSTFTEYKLPWCELEVGGGINLTSSRTASSTPGTGTTIIERAPGYVIGSLFAKMPINERLTAQVNIENVSNEAYYDGLHPGHIIIGAGRSALFTLTANL